MKRFLLCLTIFFLLEFCPRIQCIGRDDDSSESNEAEPQQCQPGSVRENDCNTCTCGMDGIEYCTLALCYDKKNADQKFE
uniref:CSON010970 protein n=1 Tax=Culicoides sonorensis TaxID=179676 RepID=A0A336LQJ3_CULSO